eukprot:1195413-Prorocentrum_minimum.AAC.7
MCPLRKVGPSRTGRGAGWRRSSCYCCVRRPDIAARDSACRKQVTRRGAKRSAALRFVRDKPQLNHQQRAQAAPKGRAVREGGLGEWSGGVVLEVWGGGRTSSTPLPSAPLSSMVTTSEAGSVWLSGIPPVALAVMLRCDGDWKGSTTVVDSLSATAPVPSPSSWPREGGKRTAG